MALFNIPKRNTLSTQAILKKTQEIQQPKIKLKSGTLINKLASIEAQVETLLGDYEYTLLDSDAKWLEYCRNAVKDKYVYLDSETGGLTISEMKQLAGICIMSQNQQEAYAPVGHISNITETILPHQVSKEALKKGFEIMINGGCKFIFHNAYFDLVVIYLATGLWLDVYWDTLLGAYNLNEEGSHNLKYLWDTYVMEGQAGVVKFNDLFEGISILHIKPKYAGFYSAHDSKMTKDVFEFQLPYLTENHISCIDCDLQGSAWLFHNVDLPLIPILAKMRVDGIEVDNNIVEKLREKYTKLKEDALDSFNSITKEVLEKLGDPKQYKLTLTEYVKETANVKKYYADEKYCASINQSYKNYCNIVDSISYPINYNSPIQIQVLFYDMLKVGTVLSKYPRKTDRHVLDTIIADDKYKDTDVRKITEALVEVKKYDKLIGTFIDKLGADALANGGKIFAEFNSYGTKTSRMSSTNPKYDWAYVA